MAITFTPFDELFASEYQLNHIAVNGGISVGPNTYNVFHTYTVRERQQMFQVCNKHLPWAISEDQGQWERTMYMYQFVIKSPDPFPYSAYKLSKEIIVPLNEKYSYKDFTGKTLTDVLASEFNNSEIIGSCFCQQIAPDTKVFPDGIIEVTFSKCNLDNVLVPSGNIVEKDCCHRKIKIQNDHEGWLVDDAGKPVEPVKTKRFDEVGRSKDPKDIPVTKLSEHFLETAFKEQRLADVEAVKALGSDIAERLGIK